MDAEHVQAEPSRQRRIGRRSKFQLPLALGIVGVGLVDIAVLGIRGSFSLTIAAPPYGHLLVHCGTLANATSSVPTVRLNNESRAKLRAMGSPSEFVVALEKLKNSCTIAAQLRIGGSITPGGLGLGAIPGGLSAPAAGYQAAAAPPRPG